MLLAAALLVVTGCKKDNDTNSNGEKMTFTANIGNGAKTLIDGDNTMKWKSGDQVVINGETFDSEISDDGKTATFTGPVVTPPYKACYSASIYDETSGTYSLPSVQHYTTVGDLSGVSPLYAQSDNTSLTFHTICALVKLNLKGTATVKRIEVSADKDLSGAFAIDGNETDGYFAKLSVSVEENKGAADVILDCGDGITLTNDGDGTPFYIALPAGSYGKLRFYVVAEEDSKWKEWTYKIDDEKALAAGFVYNSAQTPAFEEPATTIHGLFSVSATEKVFFSQGNLQAVKRGDTWNDCTWQFAATQYETVETTGQNVGENYSDTGIQSLFGWGDVNHKTSEEDTYTWPSSSDPWGTLIDNQGTWRVLSGNSTGEWKYLLETRMMLNGKPRYTNKTNGIQIPQGGTIYKGLFIYPDDYSGAEVGAGGPSTWDEINDAGIVFLPATGYRNNTEPNTGTSVYNVGSEGSYWSSSPSSGVNAYRFVFYGSTIYPANPTGRYRGFSVRLVRDVK